MNRKINYNINNKICNFVNVLLKKLPPLNNIEYSGYFDKKELHIYKGTTTYSPFSDGWLLCHIHPKDDSFGLSISDVVLFFISTSKYFLFRNKKEILILIKENKSNKTKNKIKQKILMLKKEKGGKLTNQQDFLFSKLLKEYYGDIKIPPIKNLFPLFNIRCYRFYKRKLILKEVKCL